MIGMIQEEGGPIDVLLPAAYKACLPACLGPFSKGATRCLSRSSVMIDRVARITTLFMGDTACSRETFVLRAMEIERDMLLH